MEEWSREKVVAKRVVLYVLRKSRSTVERTEGPLYISSQLISTFPSFTQLIGTYVRGQKKFLFFKIQKALHYKEYSPTLPSDSAANPSTARAVL